MAMFPFANRWLTAEDIAKHVLGKKEVSKQDIDSIQKRVNDLAKDSELIEITVQKMGEKHRPPNRYRLSPNFWEDFHKLQVDIAADFDMIVRCNDPMQCPNPDCEICTKAGIKTCYDREKDFIQKSKK